MAATIRDVAKMANLSVGTVSRYLNHYTLRKENQQRIEKAIQELNFTENLIAKGLKSRRSHSIGVVPWNLSDQFVTSIVTAIERRLETTRYNLILSTYEKSREELLALPSVQTKLKEARGRLAVYRRPLEEKYGEMLRLKVYSVVVLGFERLVWKDVS